MTESLQALTPEQLEVIERRWDRVLARKEGWQQGEAGLVGMISAADVPDLLAHIRWQAGVIAANHEGADYAEELLAKQRAEVERVSRDLAEAREEINKLRTDCVPRVLYDSLEQLRDEARAEAKNLREQRDDMLAIRDNVTETVGAALVAAREELAKLQAELGGEVRELLREGFDLVVDAGAWRDPPAEWAEDAGRWREKILDRAKRKIDEIERAGEEAQGNAPIESLSPDADLVGCGPTHPRYPHGCQQPADEHSTVSHWELGACRPTAGGLIAWARLVGMPLWAVPEREAAGSTSGASDIPVDAAFEADSRAGIDKSSVNDQVDLLKAQIAFLLKLIDMDATTVRVEPGGALLVGGVGTLEDGDFEALRPAVDELRAATGVGRVWLFGGDIDVQAAAELDNRLGKLRSICEDVAIYDDGSQWALARELLAVLDQDPVAACRPAHGGMSASLQDKIGSDTHLGDRDAV